MDVLAEIRRLYYEATPKTVARDLERAIVLLKTLSTEDEREQVAVYMDGLSQMRSEWALERKRAGGVTSSGPPRSRGSSAPTAADPRARSGRPRATSRRGR